jgi:hypothetical protein
MYGVERALGGVYLGLSGRGFGVLLWCRVVDVKRAWVMTWPLRT